MKRYALLAVLGLAGLASCSDSTSTVQTTTKSDSTYTSTSTVMGQGTVKSFMKIDTNGNPVTMGVTLSDKALVGLTADSMGWMTNLPFPAAWRSKTPFDHISVGWNPYGHEPAVYTKPHFDFHFYTVDTATQMMIPAGPETVKPDSTSYPAGYASGAFSVPMMGVHYVPVSDFAPSYSFDHTMIYGFNQKKMVFLEPMITKAFIEGNHTDTLAIAQPAVYPAAGTYFPTKYVISTDASAKTYSVFFTGFVKH